MKKIFLIILLLPLVVIAQSDAYVIKGKVKSLKTGDYVYLALYFQKGWYITKDSAKVKDGIFIFHGKTDEPLDALIQTHKKGLNASKFIVGKVSNYCVYNPSFIQDEISLILEKGPINITSTSILKNSVVKGGMGNKDYSEYMAATETPFNNRLKEMRILYSKATDEQKKNSPLLKKLIVLNDEKDAAKKKYLNTHPNSIMSLQILLKMMNDETNYDKLNEIFSRFSANIKESKQGQRMAKTLATMNATLIGKVAPDFALSDTSGKQIKLSSFRGKYVLLDFWASWCGPCRAENPNVVKAYNAYKDKNFTILGITLDFEEGKKNWINAIQEDGMSWLQVCDNKGAKNVSSLLYNVTGIPANFLIDPQGIIVEKNLRGDALEKALAKYLQ